MQTLVPVSDHTDLFTEAIRGPSYERMYPEINNLNVFSISTLSFSVEKQIDWKLKGRKVESNRVNIQMFNGKAKHEFLLSRLPSDWLREFPVSWTLPFEWESDPTIRGVTLIGHIDAIRFRPLEIVELKSTDYGPSTISEYAIRQAGTYASLIESEYHTFPRTTIYRVNHQVTSKTLERADTEKAWREIVNRAFEAARTLDKYRLENG